MAEITFAIVANFTRKILVPLLLLCILILLLTINFKTFGSEADTPGKITKKSHWFLLERKSNLEYLYFGQPGLKKESSLIKIFKVKSGIPNKRPTPLPRLLGREYWIVTSKSESIGNPETAPYFLSLDIPYSKNEPFGPIPYLECSGQCNWEIPGSFGLHGTGGNLQKMSDDDPGSSGCIRHFDEDITYIYNTLDPKKEEIRYFILDL